MRDASSFPLAKVEENVEFVLKCPSTQPFSALRFHTSF